MSNKLLPGDKLYQAFPKINEAIDNAEEALYISANAITAANTAKTTANSTQTQLNNIVIESGTSDAEVLQARGDKAVLNERLIDIEANINARGVNLKTLGAALDGVTDDYQVVMDALANYQNVVVPGDAIIGTSDTIVIGQGQSLIGLTDNSRGYGKTAKIKYIGTLNRHKAVVRMGRNAVDAEPSNDGTDIQFRNFIVDGNNLAGFGVYGTYLTNETAIDNVVASNTLEYAMYFAKSWYAKYTKLVALNNTGQGLAFGMPLEYADGTSMSWTSPSPLEMNNCLIEDVRAHSNGKRFSIDNPNTFNPTDATKRRKGYGIGFGIGNSFNAKHFTTEGNGGVGLYVYTESQPIKVIKSGYIENNCLNSGLDPAATMAGMIIENKSSTGGSYNIEDVFMKYAHGGIYHTGVLGRKVWIKNIHQPRFLKSLDGLTDFQLYAEVLKENVYSDCGLYNTLEDIIAGAEAVQTADTRNSFTVSTKPSKGFKLIMIKGDGSTPWGSYILNYDDGTTSARNFPAGLGTSYVLSTVANGNLTSITKGGGTGATASNVTFKVVNTPATYI